MCLPPKASDDGRNVPLGRVLGALVVVGAAFAAVAPSAWASGEIVDPCGPGTALVDSSNELEPQIPWLDICSVDVSGFSGTGPLRGVRSVLRMEGHVESSTETGVGYAARFRTERCTVWQDYVIYPGPARDTGTYLWVYCDYRDEPCPWPESELPHYTCGQADQFRLKDSPAISAGISGNSVRFEFDPNKLPVPSVPGGLAFDLAAREDETDPVPTLTDVWVQTQLHLGARGIESMLIGPGGDSAFGRESVPLE